MASPMPPLSKRMRPLERVELALRILTPEHPGVCYSAAERRNWRRCALKALRGEW